MSLRTQSFEGSKPTAKGAYHWWLQRLTAIALVPLAIWFVFAVAMLESASYATVLGWLQSPATAIFLALFIIITFYHTQLGLQVIIEDYVSGRLKAVSLVLINLVCILSAITGILALLKISL